MYRSLLGGALAATLLFPAFASAAPTRVGDGVLIDASSDGRYVAFSGDASEGVLDRTTGTITPLPGSIIDLADRSGRVLYEDSTLRVRDLVSGETKNVAVDAAGESVYATDAHLARDGQTVIFNADDYSTGDTVIYSHDVTTGVTTERLRGSGYTARGISEDGVVLLWARQADGPQRADTVTEPHPDSTSESYGGLIVGYQVAGDAPRVLARSTNTEVLGGDAGQQCEDRPLIPRSTVPFQFSVQQDGAAGGRYLFTKTTFEYERGYILTRNVVDRISAAGSTKLAESVRPGSLIKPSPVSSAYVQLGAAAPGEPSREATVTDDQGATWTTGQSSGWLGGNFVPIDRGDGLLFDGEPEGSSFGVFEDLSGRPAVEGPSTAAWMTLPRSTDPVDTPSTMVEGEWVDCADDIEPIPVRGTFADYAKVTVKTAGNSAGSVAVNLKPSGKEAATSANVRLTWFGIGISARTVTTSQSVNLPGILPWLPGYRAEVKINFPSGTVTGGSALRRDR